MEFWDIYDADKKPTGRTMKRNDWCLKDGEYRQTLLKNSRLFFYDIIGFIALIVYFYLFFSHRNISSRHCSSLS